MPWSATDQKRRFCRWIFTSAPWALEGQAVSDSSILTSHRDFFPLLQLSTAASHVLPAFYRSGSAFTTSGCPHGCGTAVWATARASPRWALPTPLSQLPLAGLRLPLATVAHPCASSNLSLQNQGRLLIYLSAYFMQSLCKVLFGVF